LNTPLLIDVLVPANGEGTRATVLRWCMRVGERVVKDEPLVELETDKVTVEVAAPEDGTLIEVLKAADAEVAPQEILARLQPDTAAAPPQVSAEPCDVAQSPMPRASSSARTPLSPSVRRLLSEHSLAAEAVAGTGRDGRITAPDVIAHAAQEVPSSRVPHSAIRRRIAEHMARSLLEAPHVTTLFEADLSRVLAHRAKHAAHFHEQGARLTLTVYFVSACAEALRAYPEVNATFHADALELHADVNIGVGTALGKQGLIVPVIHHAQKLSLIDVARQLGALVEKARAGKLVPGEVRGGTFTISNHGVGGSLLAAPIVINQPQVAILGVGKVERRVCVVESQVGEAIGVRSMCYLTMTIDHRALDAFQANAFLAHVVSILENWSAE
jgi:2-oxoglutarate dehydrogenase E2 component (dihydrolipoamide succinyltransferase)